MPPRNLSSSPSDCVGGFIPNRPIEVRYGRLHLPPLDSSVDPSTLARLNIITENAGPGERAGAVEHINLYDANKPGSRGFVEQWQNPRGCGLRKLPAIAGRLSFGCSIWALEQFRRIAARSAQRSNLTILGILGHVL